MADTCKTCRFFAPDQLSGGRCRRFPPTVLFAVVTDGERWENASPWMGKDEWCGEHQTRPELPTPEKSGLGELRPVQDVRDVVTPAGADESQLHEKTWSGATHVGGPAIELELAGAAVLLKAARNDGFAGWLFATREQAFEWRDGIHGRGLADKHDEVRRIWIAKR